MKKKISIIGCGWLGLPLGAFLAENGYQVKGSTTTSEKLNILKANGIEPYLLILNPSIRCRNIQELLNSEILIINIPPPKDRPDLINFHVQQISSLLSEINKSSVQRVIFISSTSVYGNENRTLSEEDVARPSKKSGMALVKIEELLRSKQKFQVTIIRFGGLIGDQRNPVKYMAGRSGISNGDAPVNLITREDCIGIIYQIIKKEIWGETFNAVADEHPSKAEYYGKMAELFNIEKPIFNSGKGEWKIVSNDKIKRTLNYTFSSIYS